MYAQTEENLKRQIDHGEFSVGTRFDRALRRQPHTGIIVISPMENTSELTNEGVFLWRNIGFIQQTIRFQSAIYGF